MVQLDFAPATRWVIASSNPLVSFAERSKVDTNFRSLAAANPEWFLTWGAGHISDLISTLNAEDPWSQLKLSDGNALTPDGSPFGSWVDCTDLSHTSTKDLTIDLAMAAVAEPLSALASALLAVSVQGFEATLAWARESLLDQDAETVYETVTSAVLWARFRRMQYLGFDDYFAAQDGTIWVDRAWKIVNDEPWDESGAARFRLELKIQPGMYLQLT